MFVDTREQHISLLHSSHQETPGLEHELTEIKRLRDEAYCTKQPKLFSFQFHGTQKQYHILIMRALTEYSLIHHYLVLPQLGEREWSVAWNHDQMLPTFHSPVDTATARTTTSVSVACIISLVNPWWNEWEAWNRSRVSASSWVQDRSERSAMAEDTAFRPYVEMTFFRWGGWNYRLASARRWNKLSLFASQWRKLFQSTGMLVLLETRRWLPGLPFIHVYAFRLSSI